MRPILGQTDSLYRVTLCFISANYCTLLQFNFGNFVASRYRINFISPAKYMNYLSEILALTAHLLHHNNTHVSLAM